MNVPGASKFLDGVNEPDGENSAVALNTSLTVKELLSEKSILWVNFSELVSSLVESKMQEMVNDLDCANSEVSVHALLSENSSVTVN